MLTAGESGEVENQGLLGVSSLHGKGGDAIVEGDRIHLDQESFIDASGKSGGGVVLVGGDWQGGHVVGKRLLGESFSMSEAGEVVMEKGAGIDASAIDNGKEGISCFGAISLILSHRPLSGVPLMRRVDRMQERGERRNLWRPVGDERRSCFNFFTSWEIWKLVTRSW